MKRSVGPAIAALGLARAASAADTPEQGIQTQVLVKQRGAWRIAQFQNTNSSPERAFPPAG